MKKIIFNMINYQAAHVLIWTNSNHTNFRPLHSRETVHFKPYIGSALCSCTHHDDRLQFCCVAMNAASSHGVILPLAHTHTNTLSRSGVVSCCCTCPPCATSRLRLKELAKSLVRRRALDDAPACLTITSKSVWWQKGRQTVCPIWRGLPW
jgi:hypothetical protein